MRDGVPDRGALRLSAALPRASPAEARFGRGRPGDGRCQNATASTEPVAKGAGGEQNEAERGKGGSWQKTPSGLRQIDHNGPTGADGPLPLVRAEPRRGLRSACLDHPAPSFPPGRPPVGLRGTIVPRGGRRKRETTVAAWPTAFGL